MALMKVNERNRERENLWVIFSHSGKRRINQLLENSRYVYTLSCTSIIKLLSKVIVFLYHLISLTCCDKHYTNHESVIITWGVSICGSYLVSIHRMFSHCIHPGQPWGCCCLCYRSGGGWGNIHVLLTVTTLVFCVCTTVESQSVV